MLDELPQNTEKVAGPLAERAGHLAQIVDDTEERAECEAWISRQFHAGRDADTLLAEVLESGWPVEDAEAMVESARRATRHLRGVVTREEVAAVSEKRYRNAFRIAFRMAMGGLPLVCAHFLLSFTSFKRIPWPDRMRKRRGRDIKPASPEKTELPMVPGGDEK